MSRTFDSLRLKPDADPEWPAQASDVVEESVLAGLGWSEDAMPTVGEPSGFGWRGAALACAAAIVLSSLIALTIVSASLQVMPWTLVKNGAWLLAGMTPRYTPPALAVVRLSHEPAGPAPSTEAAQPVAAAPESPDDEPVDSPTTPSPSPDAAPIPEAPAPMPTAQARASTPVGSSQTDAGGTRVSDAPPRSPVPQRPPTELRPSPELRAGVGADLSPRAATPPLRPADPNVDEAKLALYYHRKGEFDKALMYYRALLDRNELNVEAHNNLALLYEQKGLIDDAIDEFERALSIDPTYHRARNNFGVTLLRANRNDQALAQFRSVVAAEPRNLDALINLALAHSAVGQRATALETLLRALEIDAQSAPAHYNLARLYDEDRQVAKAVDHYRKFLQHGSAEHAARNPEVRRRIDLLIATP